MMQAHHTTIHSGSCTHTATSYSLPGQNRHPRFHLAKSRLRPIKFGGMAKTM